MPSKKSSWYRSRGYLHFDFPIGYKKAKNIVTNPNLVSKHAFFPFIDYTITSKKIKSDKKTREITISAKKRPIAYASHVDSHIYAFYANILSKKYEAQLKSLNLSESVLAFRELGKSNIDFAYEAFEQIRSMGECSAIALDFSKFFDRLDHSTLKVCWANLLEEERLPPDHFNIFKSITRFSKVNKTTIYNEFNISSNNPKNDRRRICEAQEFRNVIRKKGFIKTNKDPFGIPQPGLFMRSV